MAADVAGGINLDHVVLLHGIFLTPRSLRPLERFLTQAGYKVLNLGYPSTRQTLEQLPASIHPAIAALDGTVHFVGHSMGGLLARHYLAAHPPQNPGRVVMLGTPNQGSEVADYFKDWRLYRRLYGPAGQQLGTRTPCTATLPKGVACGIIASDFGIDPISARIIGRPNDGKVSVESTRLDGMTDHITLRAAHSFMPRNAAVKRQVLAFLQSGKFTPRASG